jgi:RHS repeat-associated protein
VRSLTERTLFFDVSNGLTGTITLPNGEVVQPLILDSSGNDSRNPRLANYTRTDASGNRITAVPQGSGSTALSLVTDTLGTTALSQTGTPPSLAYKYYTPQGAQVSVSVTYATYTVQTNFGCSGVQEFSPTSQSLINRITYPDGSYLQFSYEATPGHYPNSTGRISAVSLPTGGTISYSYVSGDTNQGIFCADGSTAGINRTTPDGTWQYRRSLVHNAQGGIVGSTVTVTDPQNNVTTYNFIGNYETQRLVYTGAATGTPIESVTTCYNGNTTNCANITTPPGNITEVNVFKSLNGGPASEVDTFYNSNNLVTDRNEYDFGATTPTRKTHTDYDTTLGNNIVNRPSDVKIMDGTGNLQSETDFTYDEDQGSLQSTGAPQLFPPTCTTGFTKCRGNLTTLKTYVSPSFYLTKTFTHYDTGQVYRTTGINGAVATNTYGACGNSFLTAVAMPLGLSRSYTWNCTGGVMTSSTDENGQISYTNYTTDPYFWRPESTKDALANITSLTYTGFTQIESVLTVVSGQSSVDALSKLDSLGRPSLTQKRQAPTSSSFDTISASYDTAGRSWKRTMPCTQTAGNPCPSPPATVTTYDGAGRPLQTTDGGTGTQSYVYSGNDLQETVGPAPAGENTKSKQLEYDGLGQLTSVCEITSANGSVTCGQSASKTGFWTRYKYNAAGHLAGVCQNTTVAVGTDCVQSPSSGQQTRTYSYDFLGRLTSETNPESGITQYFYDTAPSSPGSACAGTYNGDMAKKYDANGNTTCFTYDALHRLATVTYPSGPNAANTPAKHFVYDTATVNGTAMGNAKTRLAEAYTCIGGCSSKITDLGFTYSARGETTDAWESTPNSGGYYHPTTAYWPNGAIETLWISTLPVITYGVDGEGRTSTVSANSGQNPVTVTSYNAAGQVSGVTFGSGDSDSFTFDPNTGRMTQYQYTVNGSSEIGNLTWNTNGTLKTLGITDPFNSGDSQTCNYTHDDMARTASVNCGSPWSQTFTYDPFGNITKSGSITWQPGYNSATNRYTLGGTSYDANGNLLNDSFHSYTWTSAGKAATIDAIGLTYDALDREVEQNQSGTYYQIVYTPTGTKLGMFKGSTIQQLYVPLPGGAQAEYLSWGLSNYRHADWLGSDRLESSASNHSILDDNAYAPFGEPYAQTGNGEISFTGQNKDTVWLQYDFLHRQYDPKQGRWISPDPAGLSAAQLANPQAWNRYAYALASPLLITDRSGLYNDGPRVRGADFFDIWQSFILGDIPVRTYGWVYGPIDTNPSGNPLSSSFPGGDMSFKISYLGWYIGVTGTTNLLALQQAPTEDFERDEDVEPLRTETLFPGRLEGGWQYSLFNPGPLGDSIAQNFAGGQYSPLTVGESGLSFDTPFYRVYGGSAEAEGSWYALAPQVGGIQSQIDLALNPAWGNTAENAICVYMAPGTQVYVGPISYQGGFALGGGTGLSGLQVYIPVQIRRLTTFPH